MIRKRLTDTLTTLHTEHFPTRMQSSSKPYSAVLGIGGNIGDVCRRFEKLWCFLQKDSFIDIVRSGVIVQNPAFGYTDQADFYNSTLEIRTTLQPHALLRHLLRIEQKFGRKRLFKNGPRTLDIDIIFYENRTVNSKTLTLPHPAWHQRSSVLIPLGSMGVAV